MKRILEGKIAMVMGMPHPATAGIVCSLLEQGCTVMAPAKSLQHFNWLKEVAAPISTGRLLTQVTDLPDFEKAQDIAEAIVEKFGRIDIAVTVMIANKVTSGLSETNIEDWENMLDENITPCFVFNRILLSIMKQEHQGIYVNVNEALPVGKNSSSLSRMAASVQLQLSQQFAEEAAAGGIRYHQLFIHTGEGTAPANGTAVVVPGEAGQHIIRLYGEAAVPV